MQGWLPCTVEIQHDRPNRKIYDLTETGEAAITRWLQTHQPLSILREPLLMQLSFAAQLANEDIFHLLEQELEVRHKKFAECASISVPCLNDPVAFREQRRHRPVLALVLRCDQT